MTLIAAEPTITVAAGAAPAVHALALGKVIDDRAILADISFEIPRGRYVTLLGANGAGKTTLLRLLATLIPPSHGQLMLLGERVKRDTAGIRSRLGLIGHSAMLYRDLSARENLTLFGRLYDIQAPADRAEELLDYVGLSARGSDPVRAFSRGMTQRVAIARALVHNPELLLADEPFAGLDAPSCQMLEQMFDRLHQEGRTIILASHDIEQSLKLAEQAIVLRGGRLVMDAPTARLDARTVLAEVTGA